LIVVLDEDDDDTPYDPFADDDLDSMGDNLTSSATNTLPSTTSIAKSTAAVTSVSKDAVFVLF